MPIGCWGHIMVVRGPRVESGIGPAAEALGILKATLRVVPSWGLRFHPGKCRLTDTGVKKEPLDFGALTISQTESPLSHMERQKLTQGIS